jgi:hypothetical protein
LGVGRGRADAPEADEPLIEIDGGEMAVEGPDNEMEGVSLTAIVGIDGVPFTAMVGMEGVSLNENVGIGGVLLTAIVGRGGGASLTEIVGIGGEALIAMLGTCLEGPTLIVGTIGSVGACTRGAGGGLVLSLARLGTSIDADTAVVGTFLRRTGNGLSVAGLEYAFGCAVADVDLTGEISCFSSTSFGFQSF